MEAENIQYDEGVEDQLEDQAEDQAEDQVEDQPEAVDEQGEEPKEEKPSISFTEEQQQFINDNIVGKKVAKLREAERHAEELQRRLQELETKAPQSQGEPEVPPVPDVWDADYDEKLKARDDALLARARWESQQETEKEYQTRQQQAEEQQRMEQLHTKVATYTERAKSLGISEQELQVAGNAVSQFGVPEPLVDFMLADDQGPALTMYLAKNLAELQNVQNMNPMQAAVYLATEIKPKVMRNMKRKSPPEPTESVKGSGIPEKERGPKGATFE